MISFTQWIADKYGLKFGEAGKRTALSGNYPSLYHSIRQQPRQAWMPISATAGLADKQIGPDEKVTDGGPNVTSKKENPFKDFYKTESFGPDPQVVWKSFLSSQPGQKYAGASLDEMKQLYGDQSNWKLKGTLNGDLAEALPKELARTMMDALSFDSTQGAGDVDMARSGPRGGDVYQQTQGTRDMLKKPHWER